MDAKARLTAAENLAAQKRRAYERAKGQRELLLTQKSAKESEAAQCRRDLNVWKLVQVLYTETSEYAREQTKQRIEETVTAALQAVFPDYDLRFRVNIRQVGGQPVAEWEVISRYGTEECANSPEDARGGGITDVVSLALRLAVLELGRPKIAAPLLLDEPGKMVSIEYAGNLAMFLKTYAAETGRQVIMITHNNTLTDVADVSVQVRKSGGQSQVQQTA